MSVVDKVTSSSRCRSPHRHFAPWVGSSMRTVTARTRTGIIRFVASTKASILFMTADPSDASRLRLGRELREIQTRLQLARAGDDFSLQHRASVRPGDLTQAVFDTRPTIVHFSGHGASSGELFLEDETGRAHPVTPQALEALFALYKNEVRCVVLNACYSEKQALAISKHIDYVIGMRRAIGDNAAIAFSVGFYKALGAGRSIPECFEFGLVELRLHNIPEYQIPVLLERSSPAHMFLAGDFITRQGSGVLYKFPSGYPRYARFLIDHATKQGCLLVDPDAYQCIGHLLDDIYTNYLSKDLPPFTYGEQWILLLACFGFDVMLAPWQWAMSVEHRARNKVPLWQRECSPASLGFTRGVQGKMVFSNGIPSFSNCLIVASNFTLICDLIRSGDMKAFFSLIGENYLENIPDEMFNADAYRYKLLISEKWASLKHRVLIDTGRDPAIEMAPAELGYWLRK